jgi:TPR repeat protein
MDTRLTTYALLLCAVCLTAGCIPFPILPGDDIQKTENDIDELLNNNSSRSDVIKSIGYPALQYGSIMGYRACRHTAGIGYILCIGYGCTSGAFVGSDCFELILEFDDDDYLTGYKKSPFDHYKSLDRERPERVRQEDEPLEDAKKRAEKGDADAMYRVYLSMSKEYSEPVSAWELLCGAADQGYENAQIEVAYWHRESNWEFAKHNRVYWLQKAGVQADDRIAYLWYTLAAKDDDKRLRIRDYLFSETLSEKEIKEAKDMVTNWKPSQCQSGLLRATSEQ